MKYYYNYSNLFSSSIIVWWLIELNIVLVITAIEKNIFNFIATKLFYHSVPIHSLVRICSSIMFDSEDFHILSTWLALKTWRCNTERHGGEWCNIDGFPFFCIFLAKHRFPYFLEIFSKRYLNDKRMLILLEQTAYKDICIPRGWSKNNWTFRCFYGVLTMLYHLGTSYFLIWHDK